MLKKLKNFTLNMIAGANVATIVLMLLVGYSDRLNPVEYPHLTNIGLIFPLPIPIKAKWFVIFYAGLELFMAISTTGDGVAHLAHLGGMVFGFFMIRYWRKHPTAGYGKSQGEQFFENLRSSWEKRSKKSADSFSRNYKSTGNPDWDYNAQKQREQEEIDLILDKIRKNGYDSLTSEEKRKLFEQKR